MTIRLAILVTHPIQYFSPWFRELAKLDGLETAVHYCFQPTAAQQGEGFGKAFEWDIPLLDGYSHEFLQNRSSRPGFGYGGCDTPDVRAIVASRRHDVWLILGWNVKSYWQAIKACWQYGVPIMVRGDSMLVGGRRWYVRAAKRFILGRWIPRFSACLTVGTLNEEYYRFYGAQPARLFRVPHFVDNQWFASRTDEARAGRPELRRAWRIPDDAATFLYCGKFSDEKRPLDAVLAVERVVRAGKRAHLLMVGEGILKEKCEREAKERGVPATFAGFLNQGEIPKAYAAADALVLCSRRETWGLVVNEAMACGLPAIVSATVGCAPDLIIPGETGNLFAMGDVEGMASRMIEYVDRPERAAEQGRRARDLVRNHTPSEAALQTKRVAEKVLRCATV